VELLKAQIEGSEQNDESHGQGGATPAHCELDFKYGS